MEALNELVREAIAARDRPGPAAAAERLILFRRVVDALEKFTIREQERLATSQRVRVLIRELQAALTSIQIATSERGPSDEHVRRYYGTVTKLLVALRDLDAPMQNITPFEKLP